MNTLSLFSEKEREYFAYQARQDFLREQYTIQADLARKDQRIAQVWQEKLAAEQREAAALAEIEQLKALLAQNRLP